MVTLKLNIFCQLREDAKIDSSVNSQEEIHGILFFKVSFIHLSEDAQKASWFFLLGSNVCCLCAGSHWLWGGHSHLGRISWHRLLYTTRIAIACSCSFTCVRITLSLTEKSFTSNKTQHVKLSSSLSIDHFYFSSSKQKACSSQVFLHEKNAGVLICHFVSALHRWKISLVWSDIFVSVKMYKQ